MSRHVIGPNKIYYTDGPKFRNGACLKHDGIQWTVQLHDLGMVKNTFWAFEEEWRYKTLAAIARLHRHGC